jgi:hypothetical protein
MVAPARHTEPHTVPAQYSTRESAKGDVAHPRQRNPRQWLGVGTHKVPGDSVGVRQEPTCTHGPKNSPPPTPQKHSLQRPLCALVVGTHKAHLRLEVGQHQSLATGQHVARWGRVHCHSVGRKPRLARRQHRLHIRGALAGTDTDLRRRYRGGLHCHRRRWWMGGGEGGRQRGWGS